MEARFRNALLRRPRNAKNRDRTCPAIGGKAADGHSRRQRNARPAPCQTPQFPHPKNPKGKLLPPEASGNSHRSNSWFRPRSQLGNAFEKRSNPTNPKKILHKIPSKPKDSSGSILFSVISLHPTNAKYAKPKTSPFPILRYRQTISDFVHSAVNNLPENADTPAKNPFLLQTNISWTSNS